MDALDVTLNLKLLLPSLATALGLGLLIGTVRERQAPGTFAGVRTHALTALLGAIAFWFGSVIFLVVLALLGGLVLIGYWQSARHDSGLTGEIALPLTAMIGALTLPQPALAAALGVVTAGLLYAKSSLHRFSKELLSEREVHDGLLLLAAALVILPLVPNHTLGPYDALNPAALWRLVVLVMAVNALGHVALRVIGNRWGLALAGFFAGYVSSTAAVASFGQHARDDPAALRSAVSAALFANLASLSLFIPVLLAVAPELLLPVAGELGAAALVLLVYGLLGVREPTAETPAAHAETRMFRIGEALAFAALIAVVLLVSAAMNDWLGSRGVLITASVAAMAELQAAFAAIAQLAHQGVLDLAETRWGVFGVLATSAGAKSIIAMASGGRAYGLRVTAGLGAMLATVLAVLLLTQYF